MNFHMLSNMRVLLDGDPIPFDRWEGGIVTGRRCSEITLTRAARSDGAASLLALMERSGDVVRIERTVLDDRGRPVPGGTTDWDCRLLRVCPAQYDSNSTRIATESMVLKPVGVKLGDAAERS